MRNDLSEKPKREKPSVPIKDKLNLTIEEAAAYSGISETTLRGKISEKNNYDFILMNGTKTMIKRKKFEQFLERVDAI